MKMKTNYLGDNIYVIPPLVGGEHRLEPHQLKWQGDLLKILIKSPVAILSNEARSGKTHPTISTVNIISSLGLTPNTKTVLVVAPIHAQRGWIYALSNLDHDYTVVLSNPQGLKKLTNHEVQNTYNRLIRQEEQRLDDRLSSCRTRWQHDKIVAESDEVVDRVEAYFTPIGDALLDGFSCVVVDESHLIYAGFPYTGNRLDAKGLPLKSNSLMWHDAKRLISRNDKTKLVLVSGTTTTEGYSRLFNPVLLSNAPEAILSETDPDKMWAKYPAQDFKSGQFNSKDLSPRFIDEELSSLIVKGNCLEAGHTFFPILHSVFYETSQDYHRTIRSLMNGSANLVGSDGSPVIYDTTSDNPDAQSPVSLSRLRSAIHQLAGGTMKLRDGTSIELAYQPKIQTLRELLDEKGLDPKGDGVTIFHNFVAEGKLLRREFPLADIRQATKVEGYDLYEQTCCVVYSMSYRGASFSQMIQRMSNLKRQTPINYYFIVEPSGFDNSVLQAVRPKHNRTVGGTYADYTGKNFEAFLATLNEPKTQVNSFQLERRDGAGSIGVSFQD